MKSSLAVSTSKQLSTACGSATLKVAYRSLDTPKVTTFLYHQVPQPSSTITFDSELPSKTLNAFGNLLCGFLQTKTARHLRWHQVVWHEHPLPRLGNLRVVISMVTSGWQGEAGDFFVWLNDAFWSFIYFFRTYLLIMPPWCLKSESKKITNLSVCLKLFSNKSSTVYCYLHLERCWTRCWPLFQGFIPVEIQGLAEAILTWLNFIEHNTVVFLLSSPTSFPCGSPNKPSASWLRSQWPGRGCHLQVQRRQCCTFHLHFFKSPSPCFFCLTILIYIHSIYDVFVLNVLCLELFG